MTAGPIPPDPSAFPGSRPMEDQARFLLNYAIVAPSSHNSQPWAFEIDGTAVRVFADPSRQLEIADPERRELYLSVGCALENLRIAADHFGLDPQVEYTPGEEPRPSPESGPQHVATVELLGSAETPPADSALFEAIPQRQTNHNPYDDRPVPESLLKWLKAETEVASIGIELVTDSSKRKSIASLQQRSDERLFADPSYRKELAYWIGSGALGANWLAARIGKLAVRYLDLGEREGRKNSTLITSAPVVGVLTAESCDIETCLQAGQLFERLSLKATAEGLAVHPMSQILEVDEYRDELATELRLSDTRPVHLFRLGFSDPDDTRTPRRPVEEVLK